LSDDPSPTPFFEGTTNDQHAASSAGDVAGRYRLLQRLGEGGMGEVWLAEQSEPIRRLVAVKVIRGGKEVVVDLKLAAPPDRIDTEQSAMPTRQMQTLQSRMHKWLPA
jgi:serine/threonine protein kinase